jgi:hypothetical protein
VLGLGGTVLDLPAKHLDALAAIPGLWDLALDVMETPLDRAGLFVARDTALPTGDWEHGYIGPWKRRIATNAVCYAPGSAGYKAAPTWLTGTIEGWGGIGRTDGPLSITLDLPAGEYDLEVVYCPPEGAEWITFLVTATAPSTLTLPTGACWLHRVVALPAVDEPEPPPPPPDPLDDIRANIDDLSQIMREIESDQGEAKTRIDALVTRLDEMAGRIATLEDSKAAALSALEQLRESLV